MQEFVPGQRWLSETQAELGLGIVMSTDGRCVQIAFPATGETRLYAMRDAPLVRVELGPGERVRDHNGRKLCVIGTQDDAGLITYLCEDLDGRSVVLPEAKLDDRMRFNRPQQRLLSGRIDSDHWFSLRYRTWMQGMREAGSPALGLLGARVALIPHQLHIAAEVAGREAPRVLLADEVGLGKTIEAGLILHRMLLTGQARRVLIVTPEPLLHQWLVEMRRRFNLRFALYDRERFDAITDVNPFQDEQQVLCSLDLIAGSPDAARAALEAQWDLLVVDEAHHLAWSETDSSLEYDLIEALAQVTPGVLLLTATPEQLGRAGHFGRLRLLDPDRFHDYQVFLEEEAHYAPVADLAARLLDGEPLSAADQGLLESLLGDVQGQGSEEIIAHLLDRHGTGRVLFRNTRASIPGFPERQLIPHPLPKPPEFDALSAQAVERLTPERVLGGDWIDVDPRVDWLIQRLKALRPAKVLLICAHAETVLKLREALLCNAGIYAAVFHEGMEIVERDRAAAYFAAVEDGTQLLLCSEIGSEGRNFQFAHHLILFDLPLDPDLLEQRIGRLDRIGQTQTIRIHVPYFLGCPSEVLFRWYAEGLNAFEHSCPAASAVLAEQGPALLRALENPGDVDTLIAEARALTERLNRELSAGRDRLLEIHSHRAKTDLALVDSIEEIDASRTVVDYLTRFWDAFGVEHESGAGGSLVVRPGSQMLQEHFPRLPEDGLTATFERAGALAHEDREFLTWEHPLVREAMELLTASDLGTSGLVLIKDARFKRATLLLELLYVAECPAPPELQVGRFLPPTLVRLLLDGDGKDHAAEISHEAIRGDCLTRNLKLARQVIKSQVPRLTEMLARGETLAREQVEQLQRDATARMQAVLGEELERLVALAQVNPSVRRDEIDRLTEKRARLDAYLAQTHLRIDAARVLVTA
ncbi:RNA polymerase-associated protein RapA [Thiorhodococcus mannitoliphagus]|uniref:RNA polymerase-associated protein RapA n=1 Tax=Thiorhodococcus mannitoliphagus TaxID=329406 RepID=A0A6P1DNM5_9GAMM|nr:RNA polymerase-associated protein RapA [Thiorhodococcus mannitoliphagus]NEX19539.1 RNA polymerase-associated protein RapA [Thiorhodococcus mannitoliphagus]